MVVDTREELIKIQKYKLCYLVSKTKPHNLEVITLTIYGRLRTTPKIYLNYNLYNSISLACISKIKVG